MTESDPRKHLWLVAFSWLSALEGIAALAWLGAVPSSPESAVFHGYSIAKLVMLGAAAVEALAFGGLGVALARQGVSVRWPVHVLDGLVSSRMGRVAAIGLLGLLAVVSLGAALLPDAPQGLVGRARPLAALVALVSSESLWLIWRWTGGRPDWSRLRAWRPACRATLRVLAVFAVLVAGMLLTQIGLRPDRSGWYAPGTPLLSAQLVLAGALAAILTYLGELVKGPASARWGPRLGSAVSGLLLVLAIWLAAAIVWAGEPLHDWSHFILPPRRPNFEPYPYSDAAMYDQFSQAILTGASRAAGLIVHPLYVFYLALAHAIAGPGMQDAISLQVPLLAFIPAAAYAITSRLGGRLAGLMAAGLMILRERNAIALTNVIEVSHSKLLMADMPALMLTLLLVLALLVWLERRPESIAPALASGGILALLVLTRSQALLLAPLILGAVIWALRARLRAALRAGLAFTLGAALILLPWVWRNYAVSGRLVLDNMEYYTRFLASSYHGPEQSNEMLPGETFDAYYDRMRVQALQYVRSYPGEIALFLASHTLHNEIASLVYLPLGPQLDGLHSHLDRWPIWSSPRDPLAPVAWAWISVTLLIVAVGIGAASVRLGWPALLPLLVHLGYSVSVAPARLSGWRFILPADWVILVYYCIGLTQLAALGVAVLSGRASIVSGALQRPSQPSRPVGAVGSTRAVAVTLLGLGLMGAALPTAELLIPNRFPALRAQEKVDRHVSEQELEALVPGTSREDVLAFLQSEPAAIVLYGRSLYPVYYRRDRIHGDHTAFALAASKYNRLEFMLAGTDRTQVYIPLTLPPERFDHAQDVLVIGCEELGHVRALLLLPSSREQSLKAAPWAGFTCAAAPD